MVSGRLSSVLRARVRVAGAGNARTGLALTSERLAEIKPGVSTYDDVVRICGQPDEQHHRLADGTRRTLVYRDTQRRPERGVSVGWLTTVRHWDIEHHEVDIEMDGARVHDVVIHVRRSRARTPD
jgi:hypothetical protein